MKFFEELKKRNVYKVGAAYLVTSWLILQIVDVVGPGLGWYEAVTTLLLKILIVGFPISLVLAWVYELTPKGIIKKNEVQDEASVSKKLRKRLNVIILSSIIGLIIVFLFTPAKDLIMTDDGKYAIAVLPFDNLSADKDKDWYGIGVCEDILTSLSKINDLRVISRKSVMKYINEDKTIPEICRELGVSYILEGSVRHGEDNVVVTAQLIDENDNHIWAQSYHKSNENAIEIQREVARQVVQNLKLELTPEDKERLSTSITTDQNALELFLKAMDTVDTRSKEGIAESIVLLKKATELDPSFADAYAELAQSYYYQVWWGDIEEELGRRLIHENINKALSINPNVSRAFSVLALLNMRDNSLFEARNNFEKALEINPNDATAHMHYAGYFSRLGDRLNQLKQNAEAFKLRPNSRPATQNYIVSLLYNWKAEEAWELLQQKKDVFTKNQQERWIDRINVFLNKDWKEEMRWEKEYLADNPNDINAHSSLAYGYLRFARDTENHLKHRKFVYDSIPNNKRHIRYYLHALLENDMFEEGLDLIEELSAIQGTAEYLTTDDLYFFKGEYFFYIKNYYEALRNYEKIISKADLYLYRQRAVSLAYLGQSEEATSLMNDYIDHKIYRASIFAALKQRDSMYATLNDVNNIFAVKDDIYLREFDPFREEPEFQKFQEDNYIHFTY